MSYLPRWFWWFAVLFVAGCAGLKPQKPQVSLAALELAGLNLSHARVIARLELHNPNPYALAIDGARYRLFLAGRSIAEGSSLEPVSIAAGGRGYVDIDLSTSYLTLLSLSKSLRGAKEVDYRLEGNLDAGGPAWSSISIPIVREGIIPVADFLPPL